jgi:tetratricopeptide (TPR) repeat protein
MSRRASVRDRLLVAGAVFAACLVAAVALVPDSVPLAVRVTASIVTAGVAVAVKELREGRQREVARVGVLSGHARRVVEGRLPLVRELADPAALGASPAAPGRHGRDLQYVARTKDEELAAALAVRRFVLVTGESKCGKTRSAFEAVRKLFSDRVLVVPARADSLGALLDAGLVPADAVVWLDDLERYLTHDGVTEHMLERLTTADVSSTVVATMRSRQLARFGPRMDDERGEVEDPAWRILRRAHVVRFERRLDSAELRRVQRQVDDEGFTEVLQRYGLAEYLVAGPDLERRFVDNLASEPVGTAIVQAAVAWRIAGLIRPTPHSVLARLYSHFMSGDDHSDASATPDAYERGLKWATQRVYAASSLLSVTDEGVSVFDYVADAIEQHHLAKLPTAAWNDILDATDAATETLTVGQNALAEGHPHIAATAGRTVGGSDADLSARGMRLLGWALEEQDDLEGARAAYRKAARSIDADVASAATVDIGLLHESLQNYATAAVAYQCVIDHGDPQLRPLATVNLGRTRWRQGDLTAAYACYRTAETSGDGEQAPRALRFTGYLRQQQGDVEGARHCFEQVIASAHPVQAPKAMIALGDLLADIGDLPGARVAYEQAADTDDPELSTAGGLYVGVVLAQHGDLSGARKAFNDLLARIGSDALDVVIGQFETASVLYGPARTRSMLQHIVASAHADLAPVAQRLLDTDLHSADTHLADTTAAGKRRIYVRSPRTRLQAKAQRQQDSQPSRQTI